MTKTKHLRIPGLTFAAMGLCLAIYFAIPTRINPNPQVWLDPDYYGQFLPVVIAGMLALGGIYMLLYRPKANFNLALFGHTASEEALFNWLGLTNSSLPEWALLLLFPISLLCLYIAYSNSLKQKPLSLLDALFGISLGLSFVFLSNYLS
ncbi:MAG: hypothetical protein AAGB46_08585 [Verrucomicrobiota bacterium]